jgi:transcriptional regulator with XRE-family HTH domain
MEGEQAKLNPITFKEVDVPRETGPTIARWQLGRQLKTLRETAGISQLKIAEDLDCSESKIYKIESGDVGIGRGDLLLMLDRYRVTEDGQRQAVFDLQKQGKQRGWWSRYGQLPNNYATYVGLEGAATSVRNFELAVMPGLLQTEEYARALIGEAFAEQPNEAERRIQLRLERQKCLVEEPQLNYWSIIDESALHRRTGGRDVMREQLRHLVDMNKRRNVTVQVLPFSEGWHPGTLGSFNILEYPEDVHSPVVYTETVAGDAYLEREEEIRRVSLTYTHLHAAALSASKSRELIAAIAKDLA